MSLPKVVTYRDDPALALPGNAGYQRGTNPRSIVIHTRMGKRVRVFRAPHNDPRPWSLWYANQVRKRGKGKKWVAAAPHTVSHEGTVGVHANSAAVANYHAGKANRYSVGVEMYQSSLGVVTTYTLDSTAWLVKELCVAHGIPRTGVRGLYGFGSRDKELVSNFPSFSGVTGHSPLSRMRGKGDPDAQIFDRLQDAGFYLFETYADYLHHWRSFQQLQNLTVDGLVGPVTWGRWEDLYG